MKHEKTINVEVKKYKSRYGNMSDEQAQRYGEHLNYLISTHGGELKTSEIVEDAKKRDSPIHDFFEWDNSTAAEKYRLQQARQLVENIVEVVITKGKESEQRIIHSIHNVDGENVYVTIESVKTNINYRNELISRLEVTLENAINFLKMLKE